MAFVNSATRGFMPVRELPENLQPLIDADVLTYETCLAVEYGSEYTPSFDGIASNFDKKIADICFACNTSIPPILFLTGENNFRFKIATVKPYKSRDVNKRPFHFENIRAYMIGVYGARVVDGMEADDAICIEQNSRPDETIICTRDKDLRMQYGWHYGWESGKQPAFHPQWVDPIGNITLVKDKIVGTGLHFFYSQLLTGDVVDSIPGLPRCGPVKAFEVLRGCTTEEEMFNAVYPLYREKYGDMWRVMLLEQGQLLWMCNQLHEDGRPVLWEIPYEPEDIEKHG